MLDGHAVGLLPEGEDLVEMDLKLAEDRDEIDAQLLSDLDLQEREPEVRRVEVVELVVHEHAVDLQDGRARLDASRQIGLFLLF